MSVEYKTDNTYDAAVKRVSRVFDEFARVVVSVSGGKDSTSLFHLALREAERRGRRVTAFFLDQEAEYQSTIDIVELMMTHPLVDPLWYQVPILMTNATSHIEDYLRAWWVGETWMREKNVLAVHEIAGKYPPRFYKFFEWLEAEQPVPTAFLVGLRSKESMNRFRAVTKVAGYKDVAWSTKGKGDDVYRFYPIYDWTFGDVWKCIHDNGLPYNKFYDRMFALKGVNIRSMRVSNLIHERAFRSLTSLQEYEPETYEKLLRRLRGVHAAALYADEKWIFSVEKLPPHFATWLAFRTHLLDTTPSKNKARFLTRFEGQPKDETVYRGQCKQLLLNDAENNLPVATTVARTRARLRARWWGEL